MHLSASVCSHVRRESPLQEGVCEILIRDSWHGMDTFSFFPQLNFSLTSVLSGLFPLSPIFFSLELTIFFSFSFKIKTHSIHVESEELVGAGFLLPPGVPAFELNIGLGRKGLYVLSLPFLSLPHLPVLRLSLVHAQGFVHAKQVLHRTKLPSPDFRTINL